VYVGARVSSRAPDHVIRPVIVAVLAVSSVKLLGASDTVVLAVAAAAVLGGVLAVLRARRASTVPVLVGATADRV
jgi:hypothetical protein